MNINKLEMSEKIGEEFEWHKWVEEIPALNFPSDWDVKIIPPFNGAIVRFLVNDKYSVYLDCYNVLGFFEGPYWEIHPDEDGETYRCAMNDTESLINKLKKLIKEDKYFKAVVESFEDGIKITTSKDIGLVYDFDIKLEYKNEEDYDYNKAQGFDTIIEHLSDSEYKVEDIDLELFGYIISR